MRVIGIAGRAGSGKDTIADYLVSTHGFKKLAFADPIKAMLRQIGVDCTDRSTKELPHPTFGKSPRQMAQFLGTEWMRNLIHYDGWVRITAQQVMVIKELNKLDELGGIRGIVISDLRFENERQWLRSIGADIWHVYRETQSVSAHSSEFPLPIEVRDTVFMNDESIKELHEAIEETLLCV